MLCLPPLTAFTHMKCPRRRFLPQTGQPVHIARTFAISQRHVFHPKSSLFGLLSLDLIAASMDPACCSTSESRLSP